MIVHHPERDGVGAPLKALNQFAERARISPASIVDELPFVRVQAELRQPLVRMDEPARRLFSTIMKKIGKSGGQKNGRRHGFDVGGSTPKPAATQT
jgi:hypothetical protein